MIRRFRMLSIAAALAVVLTVSSPVHTQTSPGRNAAGLQLLISLKQSFVAPPDATRIVLHLHNSTSKPLWLYRRAKGKRSAEDSSDESTPKPSGSTVEIQLTPESSPAGAVSTPARARVLEYVEMPRPKLVKVAAGADYEETAIVQIDPASADGKTPLWGTYKIAVSYAASYPNHDAFETLGANLWTGEAASNKVTLEMRPPLPDSTGEISGNAVGSDERTRADVRVSLSDAQGQLIDQRVTEGNGQFSFSHLPFGLYYLSGRREDATQDTLVYTHQELASALPRATVQLTLVPPSESEDPKKFVHKPVLIRVVDSNQQPAAGVTVETVFTNGPLIDDLKAVTDLDGTAAMELIPGRNVVSLKIRGCKEQVERADVSPVPGLEGFRYVLNCAEK